MAKRGPLTIAVLAAALLAAAAGRAPAGEVSVAVAANFTAPAGEIAAAFAEATGHRAVLSFGATGQLYAQITQHAPFAVFLAADADRPMRAEDEGLAVAGSRFTYAVGRLALWSASPDLVTGAGTLTAGGFARLAIANPDTAPYGAAAVEVLQALGLYDTLATALVRGTNIIQAYQFVATGNAELGFVALSQVVDDGAGSRWVVPQDLHAPIRQQAVLLAGGAGNPAAAAFLDYLQGPEAAAIIRRFGYDIEERP